MSTQCCIAIKSENGYDTIYVHSDGYPEYMWPMLTENYNSEELAAKLVSFGDASCICERLEPRIAGTHSFDYREKDVCVFYHRDRGENWNDVAPACYSKREMFNRFFYAYIWEDGQWKFFEGGKESHR
jgi:hypothetical protein